MKFNLRIINIPNIIQRWNSEVANALFTPRNEIKIEFYYPLKNAVILNFSNPNGFTVREFVEAVHEGYAKIYKEEEEAAGDPGHIPGMLNRGISHGPYGIWGHDLGDLYLEGSNEKENGIFEIAIGS